MSTRKLKAFRMWANYYTGAMNDPCVHKTRARAEVASAGCAALECIPVAVIPLDDPSALLEKAMRGYVEGAGSHIGGVAGVLAAIGVLPRARKGRK
jgi:hypothetical protein